MKIKKKIFLKDLESSNGTFIEEERVEQPVELKDGMRIDFGVVVYDEEDEDSSDYFLIYQKKNKTKTNL